MVEPPLHVVVVTLVMRGRFNSTLHNEVLRLSSGNTLKTVKVSVVGVEYL